MRGRMPGLWSSPRRRARASLLQRRAIARDCPTLSLTLVWGPQGVPRTYDDHLLIIGDAAGHIDPLTGEGIHTAMMARRAPAPPPPREHRLSWWLLLPPTKWSSMSEVCL
jgi:hypothetical protein